MGLARSLLWIPIRIPFNLANAHKRQNLEDHHPHDMTNSGGAVWITPCSAQFCTVLYCTASQSQPCWAVVGWQATLAAGHRAPNSLTLELTRSLYRGTRRGSCRHYPVESSSIQWTLDTKHQDRCHGVARRVSLQPRCGVVFSTTKIPTPLKQRQ